VRPENDGRSAAVQLMAATLGGRLALPASRHKIAEITGVSHDFVSARAGGRYFTVTLKPLMIVSTSEACSAA